MVTGKSVPTVQMNPIQRLGFTYELSQNYLLPMERYMHEMGDIYQVAFDNVPGTMVYMPEHVRDVLITSSKYAVRGEDYTSPQYGLAALVGNGLLTTEGSFWRRQRLNVAPAFHKQRVSAYADAMVRYATEMVGQWEHDTEIDIKDEMNRVTMNVISWTLVHDTPIEQTEIMVEALEELQQIGVLSNFLPRWMLGLFSGKTATFGKKLDDIVYPMIEKARAHGEDRGDLLSMLLMVEDADGVRMTDKEVRDEMISLFLAGHETTANTLNWTLWLLSQHPEVEARLHEELDAVLAGRPATLEDLRYLPYTQMVIKESMRLYPAVPSVSRVATQNIQVGEYVIPEGTGISVMAYLTHRHPDVWEDPLRFDPERFSPENEPNIKKWAYYPFGGGPHVCIGNSFAMMEAPLILATVASRYRLKLSPDAKVVPQTSITMYPRYGLPMIPQVREPVRIPEFA